MRVEIALLADYAAVTDQRKLVVCGLFDSIAAFEFPAKHPRMYLALKTRIFSGEENKHKLMVRLVDPDGTNLLPALDAAINVERQDSSADFIHHLVLELDNVELQRPGPHSFDIYVDGEFAQTVSFEVVQAQRGRAG